MKNVIVPIRDDGKRIQPENRIKVFDRFFTTKPVRFRTGLGVKRQLNDYSHIELIDQSAALMILPSIITDEICVEENSLITIDTCEEFRKEITSAVRRL